MVGTKHETTGTYRFTARSADFFTSRKGERESERRYDTTLVRRKSNLPRGELPARGRVQPCGETSMPARILAFDVTRGEDPRGRMAPVTASAYPYTGERDWPGDERALSRFLSGAVLGFEQIVRHYSTMVFSLAARLVGPTDAEDVVQETFLRAYHGRGHFRGEPSLKTWLYAIALNRARARMGTLGRLRAIFPPGRTPDGASFGRPD